MQIKLKIKIKLKIIWQCLFCFVAGKGNSRSTTPFWHPTLADRNFLESKIVKKIAFLVIKLTWCDQKWMKICISRLNFGARAHCAALRGQTPHVLRKTVNKKLKISLNPGRSVNSPSPDFSKPGFVSLFFFLWWAGVGVSLLHPP